MGSLRQNLQYISLIRWKDKLNLLFSIAFDLKSIHSQNIIHRDLHSDNILQDNLHSAYIADLGLSIQYLKQKDSEVYGVLPYVAPEILNGQQPTMASDIYSFGMIMWEVLYTKPVMNYHESNDVLKTIDGLRPPINNEAPQCYVNLMERCWNQNPEKRPSAKELCEVFKKWHDHDQILKELNESKLIIPEHIRNSDINANNGSKLINLSRNSDHDFIINI
ncbi:kinase-like domain-containing protein [Gigaspora rosea]|uniref:Kinase-like domain-containing protein n=1 Tax=Gigaspora rosea TaxID=44941 RepID=A0A397UAQ9_9GLOM|nr:kinase-like domain-containing protein [Gigaspora rosea]